VVRLLLADGRVDPAVESNRPLAAAVENGHIAVAQLLLAHPRVTSTLSRRKAKAVSSCLLLVEGKIRSLADSLSIPLQDAITMLHSALRRSSQRRASFEQDWI
jgi:hypothetical protein